MPAGPTAANWGNLDLGLNLEFAVPHILEADDGPNAVDVSLLRS
jgi:hypothetical protein